MSLEAAIICSALLINHEARGESIPGQYAVVHTARNRAKYNPDNMCKVVFASYQFSWTIKMPGHSSQEFEKALFIAQRAWASQDITYGSTHYHVRSGCPGGVKPYWTAKMKKVATIGCHIFYREN